MGTKRRGAGEGAIYRRHDHETCPPLETVGTGDHGQPVRERPRHPCKGRWCATVDLGRDERGRRRRRVVYGRTKVEVQSKLAAAAQHKAKHLPQPDDKLTVGGWLDRWLASNSRLSDGSRSTYADTIRLYIRPAVGSVRLTKLSVADVERMTNGLLDRGLSASTAKAARRVLSVALNAAMRADLLHRNVAALSEPPRSRSERRADLALTASEAEAVIAAAEGHRLAALAIVLLTLGIRKGEALALRWEDVDLGDDSVVHIGSSLSRVPGKGLVRGATKTVGSERTIPLVEPALSALKAHRKAQAAERLAATVWVDDGVVFSTEHGQWLDPRNALRQWHGWTDAAGLGKRRMHSSRHTTATLLLERGVPLEVVSAVLGHSSISITADVYSTVRQNLIRRALTNVRG